MEVDKVNDLVAASPISALLGSPTPVSDSIASRAKMNGPTIIIPVPEDKDGEDIVNNGVKAEGETQVEDEIKLEGNVKVEDELKLEHGPKLENEVTLELNDDQTARLRLLEQVVETTSETQPPIDLPSPEALGLKLDWLGTSTIFLSAGMKLQLEGNMDRLIAYRKAATKDQRLRPYYPGCYIELASVDNKLGFCDIGAGNGYRALVLCQAGLGTYKRKVHPPNLGQLVRNSVCLVLNTSSSYFIDSELNGMQLQAYKALLLGISGCSAFYDGCLWAEGAVKKYPNDPDLQEIVQDLRSGYLYRLNPLKDDMGVDRSELEYMGKVGRILQKPYPWMDKTLFYRTAGQIKTINKTDAKAPWKVKPVVFGTSRESSSTDVGSLGLFAKRNIEEGEIIMVDKTLAGVSNIPSSKCMHCDACHAVLVLPFGSPEQIVRPMCCGKVVYCSQGCHDAATGGYHKLLCNKDLDWVYNRKDIVTAGKPRSSWRPILFLRLMAIVIADMKKLEVDINPLRHALLSRMAANYKVLKPGDIKGCTHDWQFGDNVVVPTRLLMELGVDIFEGEIYSPEVIQTIFWRFENNANMATTFLTGTPVLMVSINPHYLFINHSCDPNVSWHGAIPYAEMSTKWLMDRDGKILKPGFTAVWCMAGRDIKKGEELKISYIGDPKGVRGGSGGRIAKRARLEKWFDNGCGCELCEQENREGIIN